MNSRSPGLTFVLIVTAVLIGMAAVFLLVPLLMTVGGFALSVALAVLPIAITVIGLISCLTSEKRSGIKALWVIIMILAPILGPILWFVWGRQHT